MIQLLCDICGEKAVDWDKTTLASETERNTLLTIENIEIKLQAHDSSSFHFNVRPGHLCLMCTFAVLHEHLVKQMEGEDGDQDQD